jgi:DNA-binding NtrC family response regulator
MEYIPQVAETAARLHLLVVDADAAGRSACAEIAASMGYAVESTGDLGHARNLLRGRAADILLVNLPAGSSQGLELVAEVKLLYPQTSVIAMTASGSVNAAVEALRRPGLPDQALRDGRAFHGARPGGGEPDHGHCVAPVT